MEVLAAEGENRATVHFIQNEIVDLDAWATGRGIFVAHLFEEGEFDPVILKGKMAKPAETDFVDKVAADGLGGHDDDFLVGHAVEGLCGRNGGTGLARPEAVIDEKASVGGALANILFDEALVQKGLDAALAARNQRFAGFGVEFLVLDCGRKTKARGVGVVNEFVKGLATRGHVVSLLGIIVFAGLERVLLFHVGPEKGIVLHLFEECVAKVFVDFYARVSHVTE